MNALPRPALVHPIALLVLIVSLALATAVQIWAPWSGRALWLAGWGVLGYAVAALAAGIAQSGAMLAPTSEEDEQQAEPNGSIPGDLLPHVEEALRRLNNLSALGTCALVSWLPLTVSRGHLEAGGHPATRLEIAQVLRVIMVEGIERLRPAAGEHSGEAEALQYAILHEEYVLGRPNHQIMTRHNVSESTFHRYRRSGARALAAELGHREELLAKTPTPA